MPVRAGLEPAPTEGSGHACEVLQAARRVVAPHKPRREYLPGWDSSVWGQLCFISLHNYVFPPSVCVGPDDLGGPFPGPRPPLQRGDRSKKLPRKDILSFRGLFAVFPRQNFLFSQSLQLYSQA